MKITLRTAALLLGLSAATVLLAAEALPTLNGLITTGADTRFILSGGDGKTSPWIKLGDSFQGYLLKAFDPKSSVLELEQNGRSFKVPLASGRGPGTGPATPVGAATLADANELFRVMRFDEMMTKMLDQQKKAMQPMLQQMGRAGPGMSPEESAAFRAFQEKQFDDLMGAMMGAEMRADMARVYSEIFTKDELAAQSAFYGTAAGQAVVDKTPDVQAKMQELMLPRMMQLMPKMQQANAAFMKEMAEKRAAAGK